MGGEHVQVKGFTERGPNPQSEIRNPKSNDPIGFAGPDHPAAAPQNSLSRRSRLISLECAPVKRSISANPGAGGATHLGFWILDCGFLGLWTSALGLTIANRKSQIENGMGAGGATHLGFWISDCGFLGLWASALGLTIANRKSQIENGMGAGGANIDLRG